MTYLVAAVAPFEHEGNSQNIMHTYFYRVETFPGAEINEHGFTDPAPVKSTHTWHPLSRTVPDACCYKKLNSNFDRCDSMVWCSWYHSTIKRHTVVPNYLIPSELTTKTWWVSFKGFVYIFESPLTHRELTRMGYWDGGYHSSKVSVDIWFINNMYSISILLNDI